MNGTTASLCLAGAVIGGLAFGNTLSYALEGRNVDAEGQEAEEFSELALDGYLHLVVDNRTGCHYLKSYKSGLVPRMYSDGTQVCD